MYPKTLIVHLQRDFYGRNADRATQKALDALVRFLRVLERNYGLLLVKRRVQNIKVFRAHYAEVGNELAEQARDRSEFITIHASDDGKLWAQIDVSKGVPEFETQHPKSAYEDMQDVVRPFFNDLRDNKDLPKPSEMYRMFASLVKANADTALGLSAVTKILTEKYINESPQSNEDQSEIPDYIS